MADKTETTENTGKVYPGQLARYTELREARKEAETQLDTASVMALTIAEELAGLSYILDGIRYAARRTR